MKTKKLVLSFSVFALAIIGAFAFSTMQSEQIRQTDGDPNSCQPITAGCTGTEFQCKIVVDQDEKLVYDSTCLNVLRHNSEEPIE